MNRVNIITLYEYYYDVVSMISILLIIDKVWMSCAKRLIILLV